MLHFDLTDVRLFLAVARLGSVSKAVAEVPLAISSASARLKELEAHVGAPLFTRHARGMTLTAAGKCFARHAQEIDQSADELRQELQQLQEEKQRPLRLGTLPNAMATWLPEDVSSFLASHPQVSLTISSHLRARPMLQEIADGHLDLGITSWNGDFSGLQHRDYRDVRLAVVFAHTGAVARRLKQQRSVKLTDLTELEYVGLQEEMALAQMIAQAQEKSKVRLQTKIRMESYADALELVRQGTGFAILPVKFMLSFDRRLRALPLEESWAQCRLRLWFSAAAAQENAALRSFLSFLEKKAL